MTTDEAIKIAERELQTSSYLEETSRYPGVIAIHRQRASWLLKLLTLAKEAITAREQSAWFSVTDRLPTKEDANEYGRIIAIHIAEGAATVWNYEVVSTAPQCFTLWTRMPIPPKEAP